MGTDAMMLMMSKTDRSQAGTKSGETQDLIIIACTSTTVCPTVSKPA